MTTKYDIIKNKTLDEMAEFIEKAMLENEGSCIKAHLKCEYVLKKLIINEKDGMRHCPNCDTFFLSGGKRHCERCGQALDWSEENG